MNLLKSVFSLFLISLLVACGGGGGNSGTPILGPGPGPAAVNDIVVTLSASTISNSGAETVTATITTVDVNRVAVANVPVTVSVDNNGIITPNGTSTDASGTITATVAIGADRTNRTITVTAKTGTLTKTAALMVVATGAANIASDLVLVLGSATISNSGAQTITATATALDAKRNTLQGVPVTISVDSNAVATATGSTTDAAGVMRAAIGIGADRTNRTITVTATSGTLSRQVPLRVTEGTVGVPTAADLSLVLSAASLNNGGTNTVLATATAVDANRNVVSGIPVTFTVDNSAIAAVSGATTSSAGVVTAAVGIGSDRSNRVVTVTATSGALTKSASFRVLGADLGASFAALVDANSKGNRVEYRLVDTNALAMVGQTISVAAPGLPTSSGVTDINGKFVYIYDAPSTTGALTLTASAAGDSEVTAITVQTPGGGSIPPALALPRSASLAANPSVVSVNTQGSNTNQVELRALFLGADNSPVPRVRVRFDLDGNANSTDGVPSWLGGNYAYSDASGVARGTFTAGQRSSPTNGVTVRACYDINDFPITSCPNATRATLTVASEALSVNIRTNELIKSGAAQLTYIKEFVVMVVDAAGQAKADVLITPSVDLLGFYKGFYFWNGKRWQQTVTLAKTENYRWSDTSGNWASAGDTTQPVCPNDDVNRNGVREAGTFVAAATPPALAARGEDLNWNGELDPRKSDVAIKAVGSTKTDANGLAIIQIEYGRNLATWVDFIITVTASGVAGSETRAKFVGVLYGVGNLPAPADSVTNENAAPAFAVSPYGRSAVCTDDK